MDDIVKACYQTSLQLEKIERESCFREYKNYKRGDKKMFCIECHGL